jgi:hypothetical protein
MQMSLFVLIVLAFAGVIAFTQWRYFQLQKKYGEFLDGAKAKKVEELIKEYAHNVVDAQSKLEEMAEFVAKMHSNSKYALSKQAIIRFNPFGDTGGNQSFVLALLDNNNNGVIVSSVHARTGTRVYAKEIRDGLSKYNLSDEETIALQKALDRQKSQENVVE